MEATTILAPATHEQPTATADSTLNGSVLVLIQFDVCEEIHLDQINAVLQASMVKVRALLAKLVVADD